MVQSTLLSQGSAGPLTQVNVTHTLLCFAAAENNFRVGEDKGGVKKHTERSEECRQRDLGENIIPHGQLPVTADWSAAAKPGVMLAFAQ